MMMSLCGGGGYKMTSPDLRHVNYSVLHIFMSSRSVCIFMNSCQSDLILFLYEAEKTLTCQLGGK